MSETWAVGVLEIAEIVLRTYLYAHSVSKVNDFYLLP